MMSHEDYIDYENLNDTFLPGRFMVDCGEGKLEHIQYLIRNRNFKDEETIRRGFVTASINGHLNIVKYLHTTTDLESHPNTKDDDLLERTCRVGGVDCLDYLIKQQKKELININDLLEKAILSSRKDMIEYLIFEFNIKPNRKINAILEKYEDYKEDLMLYIIDLLNKKELNQNLEKHLPSVKINSTKVKL